MDIMYADPDLFCLFLMEMLQIPDLRNRVHSFISHTDSSELENFMFQKEILLKLL